MAQRLVRLTLGEVYLVDALSGAQRLDHDVAPLDQAVRLGGEQIFLFVVHTFSFSARGGPPQAGANGPSALKFFPFSCS